jgi:hypothetical protein
LVTILKPDKAFTDLSDCLALFAPLIPSFKTLVDSSMVTPAFLATPLATSSFFNNSFVAFNTDFASDGEIAFIAFSVIATASSVKPKAFTSLALSAAF